MQILAISGSLRAVSSNTAVLRAAAMLAPTGVNITIYSGLGDLPHFNPDNDVDPAPLAVASFREQLKESARIIEKANITLPIAGSGLDEVGITSHLEISHSLKLAIEEFTHDITLLI